MKRKDLKDRFAPGRWCLILGVFTFIGVGIPLDTAWGRAILLSETPEKAPNRILMELFLAKERKGDLETIERTLKEHGIRRIRPQFFRLGNPPRNIAIGKNIPAETARLAIDLAVTYNGGIQFLLPQFRFFPDQIVIGSSAFDEASQIPVKPEDLKRLSDPSLTTAQFHELYRHLTGEDQRLPTYLP